MRNLKWIFGLFIFIIINITDIYPQKELILLYGDGNDEKETKEYVKRVKEDGGEIKNPKYTNELIKMLKEANVYNNVEFWVSPNAGLKIENDIIIVEYDIKTNDLSNSDVDARPRLVSNIAEKMNGILYDKNDDYLENEIFNLKTPYTVFIVIKQDSEMNMEAIVDARKGKSSAIYFEKGQANIEPLIIEAGKKLQVGVIDTTVNIIMIEFNEDSSNVFINNVLTTSGKIGNSEFDGIMFGALKNLNKNYYLGGSLIDCGIIKELISEESKNKIYRYLEKNYR